MNKRYFTGLILTLAALIGAACSQTASNGNTAMNHGGMNHNSMNSNSMNMNGMNHNSMPMNSNMPMDHSNMKSDPNAASAPYDLQFIDTMTSHHSSAVEMAKMVDGRTENADLKKFAAQIISDQEKEIGQMKDWREKWFKGAPRAMNMEMSGMADSMKMMSGDEMKKMEAASGKDFDIHFLDMMTPHHAGAVMMAKEALSKAEHPEIKTLAGNIIKAQEAEIKMMNEWKAKWSK